MMGNFHHRSLHGGLNSGPFNLKIDALNHSTTDPFNQAKFILCFFTKVDICAAPDVLEEKSPIKLCRTVEALLQVMGVAPPQISLAKPTTPR